MEFELNKIVIDLQKIPEDKLGNIGHGREEPSLDPSLDITGQNLEPPLPLPIKLNKR